MRLLLHAAHLTTDRSIMEPFITLAKGDIRGGICVDFCSSYPLELTAQFRTPYTSGYDEVTRNINAEWFHRQAGKLLVQCGLEPEKPAKWRYHACLTNRQATLEHMAPYGVDERTERSTDIGAVRAMIDGIHGLFSSMIVPCDTNTTVMYRSRSSGRENHPVLIITSTQPLNGLQGLAKASPLSLTLSAAPNIKIEVLPGQDDGMLHRVSLELSGADVQTQLSWMRPESRSTRSWVSGNAFEAGQSEGDQFLSDFIWHAVKRRAT